MATTRTNAGAGFRGDIQGLRAIAVGAVVLYHAGVPFLTGGYIGVDVFFVISGFLITTHLLQGLERDGRVRFASFYARRARRILPASFVVLALSVIAALIWMPPLLLREVWLGAVATALYIPNYLFAYQGTNYLAESTPSLVQHYWSLGIEEQFYLLWPLILLLAYRVYRRPARILVVLVVLGAASFAGGVWLTFVDQPWAFFGLPTRAWELIVGGLVAVVLLRQPRVVAGAAASILGWVGIVGILVSALVFTEDTQFPGFAAALPVLSTAAIILGGATRPRFGPAATLSVQPMQFLGAISYSLYLVHWPLQVIPQAAVGFEHSLPLWVTLLLGLVAVPLAWVMVRFVENPARNSTWLTKARPRRPLLAAAAGSMAAVALATGAYAYSNTLPLHSDQAASSTEISAPPVETQYVPNNLVPDLRAASDDQPRIYDDGCHLGFGSKQPNQDCVYGDPNDPRIVLFGDSHASQWFPAVMEYAERNGMSLDVQAKSSCPSVDAELTRNAVPYTACSEWRDAVFERISSQDPALVILANYGDASFAHPAADYGQAWGNALGRSLGMIDAPTVVLADTPDLGATPAVCLSANVNDAFECGRPAADALASPTRQEEARVTAEHGDTYIDLTPYLCSDKRCAPILGNTLIYRDAHHITATFSEKLADALEAEMVRANVLR